MGKLKRRLGREFGGDSGDVDRIVGKAWGTIALTASRLP